MGHFFAAAALVVPLLLHVPARAADASREREPAFLNWLARAFNRELRELDERRASLAAELPTLPTPAGADTSARLGWHTPGLASPGSIAWAQVDLGNSEPIDLIALAPASGEADGKIGAGYGFPLRFRIETSDDDEFATRRIAADFTGADFPNPGAFPVLVRTGNLRARYVRVTATQAWPRREDWIVALGEIMILSGERNLAAGRPVRTSAAVTSRPLWDPANLTDEQSVLGPPVGLGPSPSNGYLAAREGKPDLVKWVQVDLGRAYELDEVRLFPTRPTEYADRPGSGFPVRFRIEGAAHPEFEDPRLLFDTGESSLPNPGENIVTVRTAGSRARVVRITATQLYDRGTGTGDSFALAELEAWSGGRNVARGARVTSLDRFDDARYPRWQPEYLVDGYNSRHPILGLPTWLAGLVRRQAVGRELAQVDEARAAAIAARLALLLKTGAGSVVLLAAGLAGLSWRARIVRRRAVETLRRGIARDLHDEIGSYLGSIGLISAAAAHHGETGHTREDFAEIARIAAHTNQSLREIVWLLDTRPITRAELVARMREAAPGLLANIAYEFETPDAPRDGVCPLDVARNVWLIFREALHNAARHAKARHVRIRVSEPAGGFALEIADDGCGFDEKTIEHGHGLKNLQARARELGGRLHIQSRLAQGTLVRLEIPTV